MLSLPEQFSHAAKASLACQFDTLAQLSAHACDKIEQLLDLNLSLLRASMEDSAQAAKQLLGARDAKEFIAVGSAQYQPARHKALTYSKHLLEIAASTRADLGQVAEERIVERHRTLLGVIETVAKDAPAGSQRVVELVKSTLGNASAGVEQLSKTSRQAATALDSQLVAAAERFATIRQKPASRARKT